jgi:uncharacterized RDD family membrane protein YckC
MVAIPTTGRGPTVADTSSACSPHHLTVVTPEAVVLDFRAAGLGSRTLAKMIDLLIQFFALFATLFIVGAVAFASESAAIVLIIVLLFVVFYGYSTILETWWNGRTIGKRIFNIRVITTEGGPVRFRHAAIRSMIGTFDFFFPAPGGLIAVSFALLTKRSQRLGDLAAGTIVIRDRNADQAPVFFGPAYGAEAVAKNLDTSLLDAAHYTLVREVLLRGPELMPEARWQLTEQLAERVAAHTGNPRPVGLDGERYLVSMLYAHQARFAQNQPPPPMNAQPQRASPPTAPPPPGAPRPYAAPPTGLPHPGPPPWT